MKCEAAMLTIFPVGNNWMLSDPDGAAPSDEQIKHTVDRIRPGTKVEVINRRLGGAVIISLPGLSSAEHARLLCQLDGQRVA